MNTEQQVITQPAFKVEVRSGKPVYVLYGILEVDSLDLARELLTDRRVTPRHAPVVLQNVAPLAPVRVERFCGFGTLAKYPWE